MPHIRHAMPVLLLALFAMVAVGCYRDARMPALESATRIDLQRYMGAWYVIANIPYFAERGKVATRDEYSLREDGRIENLFVYRKGFDQPEKRLTALATVQEGSGNARWKIRFFWLFNADYLVLEVDPDYQWALIGHPGRKYAWILARDPAMDAEQYLQLLQRFARHGYDPAQLQRVPQFPEQQGTPGFQ